MDNDDRVMNRVRNLLALAENAGTEGEAEAAREKAEAAMAKHGLTDAMIHASGQDDDEITSRDITVRAPYARQKSLILGAVATFTNTRCVVHTYRRNARGLRATMVGYSRDLDRAEVLFTSLLLQASRDVMRQQPPERFTRRGFVRENAGAFRRSWLLGFVAAISQRMEHIKAATHAEAEQESTSGQSAALVVRDRNQKVADHLKQLYPTMSDFTVTTKGSGAGQGYEAGQRADLEQTKVQQAPRAALH